MQHTIFIFGLIVIIWRIISSLAWTLETVKRKNKSVLKYRLSAYFEIFTLGVIFISGSHFADMNRFWFIFGMFFIGLSVYSSCITLIAVKNVKLEPLISEDSNI